MFPYTGTATKIARLHFLFREINRFKVEQGQSENVRSVTSLVHIELCGISYRLTTGVFLTYEQDSMTRWTWHIPPQRDWDSIQDGWHRIRPRSDTSRAGWRSTVVARSSSGVCLRFGVMSASLLVAVAPEAGTHRLSNQKKQKRKKYIRVKCSEN